MIKKKTWKEFRETGLVLIINQILHIFGWAIVYDFKENGEIECYPARVKFRGFDNESITNSYRKISRYMKENADILLEEAEDEEE